MSDLHLVHYDDPQAFLKAMQPFDDNGINLALGPVYDQLDPVICEHAELTKVHSILMAVWKGEQVIAVLTKVGDAGYCILDNPRGVSERFPDETKEATRMLASALLELPIDPRKVDRVRASVDLMKVFLETWTSQLSMRGLKVISTPPEASSMAMQCSYATRTSIPSPPFRPPAEAISITKAETMEEADVVAAFAVAFSHEIGFRYTLEQTRPQMRAALQQHLLWVCRVVGNAEIVGFVVTGRATPQTVAIRKVYVVPAHRRKGIAEAMVKNLVRWHLGEEPIGVEGMPPMRLPRHGRWPREVCLNVGEEATARVYTRCGFLLQEGARDSESGFLATFDSVEMRPKYVEIAN